MKVKVEFAALMLATLWPLAALAQSATADWNQTYAETGKGHRVGDANAPLQVIEFISYTCPHCAQYAQESEGEMRLGYVGEGKAAVEVRHFIRNQIDLAAAMVTECGPPERFFDRHRAMLRAQPEWIAAAQAATPGQRARWSTGSMPQQMQAIGNDLNFAEVMEPFGLSSAEVSRCLADTAKAQAIYEASAANVAEFAVPGTPSFVINGTLQANVHTWDALRPLLGNIAP